MPLNRKPFSLGLLIVAFTLAFTSCQNETSEEEKSFEFIAEARTAVITELIVNDLESIVLNAFINLDLKDPGGQIETHIDLDIFSVRGNCAREIDATENRMTLDLSSCIDAFDIDRSGELVIEYEDAFDEAGNIINVRMNDYEYENISITGDFIIRNVSEPDSEVKNYSLEFPLTNFALANNDESFTLSGTRNIMVFEQLGSGIRHPDLQSIVDFDWSINEGGPDPFIISTPSTLQHRLDCWSNGLYFPRAGVQRVSSNAFDLSVDYYKSVCGWELEIKEGDLVSEYLTLQKLFFD